jgi:hypothetical protein
MISEHNIKFVNFLFEFRNIELQSTEDGFGVWYDFAPVYMGSDTPTLPPIDLTDLKLFGESLLHQFFIDQQNLHESGVSVDALVKQMANQRQVDMNALLPYNNQNQDLGVTE